MANPGAKFNMKVTKIEKSSCFCIDKAVDLLKVTVPGCEAQCDCYHIARTLQMNNTSEKKKEINNSMRVVAKFTSKHIVTLLLLKKRCH